jgi:hypothetical protein
MEKCGQDAGREFGREVAGRGLQEQCLSSTAGCIFSSERGVRGAQKSGGTQHLNRVAQGRGEPKVGFVSGFAHPVKSMWGGGGGAGPGAVEKQNKTQFQK